VILISEPLAYEGCEWFTDHNGLAHNLNVIQNNEQGSNSSSSYQEEDIMNPIAQDYATFNASNQHAIVNNNTIKNMDNVDG
jgi:hypothetical protein